MRLSDQQLETIRSLVARMVPAESQYELILFGSRLNDRARGGDVDLYLETTCLDAAARTSLQHRLRPALEEALDLPADLVIQDRQAPHSLVSRIARKEGRSLLQANKRVFDLVKDFGTSESPKSTRSSTTHWCPGRPGHPAFRHNIASSLRLHTGLPYDWTPRSDAPLGSPLAPSARRVSRVASRLPGTTRLRFALHGGQRPFSDQASK